MLVSLRYTRPERRPELPDALLPFAALTSCHRGQEIYGPEDPAEQYYFVVSGLATKSTVTAHGDRQIIDFLLPGDWFGLTARDRHTMSVEAVLEGTVIMSVEAVLEGTVIACLPRRRLELIARSDPEVGRLVLNQTFEVVTRFQVHICVLGRTSAVEKIAAFLLEMSERLTDRTTEVVVLPMSRYDIADYLAMSVETVSRALTDLTHNGAITFLGKRHLRIVDRGSLKEADELGVPRRH
jgi:CRP/FNR family transcriptional regulator, nitrogen fixation regulation protein